MPPPSPSSSDLNQPSHVVKGVAWKEEDLQLTSVNCCSNFGQSTLRGMLDLGNMLCTLSLEAEFKLRAAGVLPSPQPVPEKVVLVGCGGLATQPQYIYDLGIEIYVSKFIVPTCLVARQKDDLIIGNNINRPIIQRMRSDEKYWELICSNTSDPECEQFLQLLSCITRWSGPELPDKVGTVRLQQAVTLAPQLLCHLGVRSILEPTSSHSAPKDIIVGWVVAPMWGGRWVPMKILKPTKRPVTLCCNSKVADVFLVSL